MMKKLIVLSVLLLALTVGAAAPVSAAESARVLLSDCDSNETMLESHRSAVVPDATNYVGGEASLMVTSILPNILLPFETSADASAVDPEEGYLEFYFYFDTPEHYDFASAYSFIKLTSETPDDQKTQVNSFVWSTAPLRNVEPGWNYIALKLSAATFTGPKTKEEVLADLNGFFFIIWSVQKPDAVDSSLTMQNYYNLKTNLDQLSVVAQPESFDGFPFTYHQRLEEIQLRQQAVWVDDGTAQALRTAAYVFFGLALAVFVGIEIFLIVRRKSR